jgi:hypothetical protein
MARGDSVENDSNKLEICMKENLNLLNKNKCVKLYRKKFYNSLKNDDDTGQLKCFIKLYNIINRCINKFKYPILEFNFIIDVFFSNNENNIYFKTAIVLNKDLPASSSANTCNIFYIQSSFNYFKQDTFMNSLPFIFSNLIMETNKKKKTTWGSVRITSGSDTARSTVRNTEKIENTDMQKQTSRRYIGTTTMNTTWYNGSTTAFTSGTGTSIVMCDIINFSDIQPIFSYNEGNDYTGFIFPGGFEGKIIFSNLSSLDYFQFGMAMSGGGGGRGNKSSKVKCGGGGGGCYFNNDFNISSQCEYTISVGLAGSGGTEDTEDASQGGSTTITTTNIFNFTSTSIECTGGLPATGHYGFGGTCTDPDYGFGGGDGGLSNAAGQDAIITNTTSNVIGNYGFLIECMPQGINATMGGGGGGASIYEPYIAMWGEGYGGTPNNEDETVTSKWTKVEPLSLGGGGAGTKMANGIGADRNSGLNGGLVVWWGWRDYYS